MNACRVVAVRQLQRTYCLRKFSAWGMPTVDTVETDNGAYIVCWHPERKFPYECTRPLPQVAAIEEKSSYLKPDLSSNVYDVFNPKSVQVIREELSKITYTSKHRWYPRARDKYAKKTPPDREYL